ncbi:MAG: cation:proton antiporter [Devosia sp.]
MPHDAPLITTIVAGLVLAFVFGAIANRFRMPPLVGYLVAGVLIGPYTPGFVANGEIASELSEIGVVLLMFGVGLNFSINDLLHVQAVAVPGALLRIAGGTAMGMGFAYLMGWSLGAGLIFGLALSVASTVVLLKALQERHLVDSDRGRIAIGWVIVEDIAMVLALVLIPAFATVLGGHAAEQHDPFITLIERLTGIELNIFAVLSVTIVKLAAFVGFMLVVGRRIIPGILHFTAHTGSRELFRLAVLAIALGVAAGAAYLFGVSLALGAFFAGMILSESQLSQRAAQESLPLRDAFAVLFFVSVGMLFDPTILVTRPWEVLGTLFIIVIGKSILGFLLVIALRRTVSAALTINASLAQIGEFSFILAALGIGLGILPPEAQSLILAGSILSIIVNPLVFYLAEHVRPRLEARIAAGVEMATTATGSTDRIEPALTGPAPIPSVDATAEQREDEHLPTRLTGHVVLIGYGRVGSVVAEGLKRAATPFVLIEDADKRVAAAHTAGIEVVVGNAASPESLALANVAAARAVIIAIPNAFEAGQAVEQCHRINPALRIVARAHADEEVAYLHGLGAEHVIMGEREIGLGMLGWVNGESEREATPAIETAPRLEPATQIVADELRAQTAALLEPLPSASEMEPPAEPETPAPASEIPASAVAASDLDAASAVESAPSPRRRPTGPATAAAMPFNPEVPPEPVES